MKKFSWVFLFAFCLAVLSGAPAEGATLRVGADQQFKTLQEAVMTAKDFDTIRIDPGVYRAGKAVAISGRKGLNIEGAGQDKVQLIVTDLFANVVEIYRCDGIRIAGVSARHSPGTENTRCAGAVIDIQHATNTTIVDCELNGCGSAGVAAIDSRNVNIVHNNIHHNSYAGLWLIRVTGTVQDNLIADNNTALMVVDGAGITFKNNTMTNNGPRKGGPLAAEDFVLKGVSLGDTLAAVTGKLGNPAQTSRVEDGFSYDFGVLEVIVGQRNTVVNLLTDAGAVATRRGIRTGAGLGEIIAAYGENYEKTELDDLDLYEYTYSASGRGTYVLRFAVSRATATVRYIGCRAKSAIEAAF